MISTRLKPVILVRLLQTAITLTVAASLTEATAAGDQRPNVLFIFADDQAYNTIHALGNDRIETPNLDRLVHSGTTLTHAYNQGAWGGAVCVASRTMLMTGRYLWHARDDYARTDELYRQTGKLLPQTLEASGYSTWFSGKWHLRADASKAFGTARHIRPGMPRDNKEIGYHRPVEGTEDPWKPWDTSLGGFWEGGTHWSEVLGNDGVEYIEKASKQENPFFMYLAFNAPHDPRQSPKEFVDKYPLESIPMPDNYLPLYPHFVGSNKIRDEVLAPFPRTPFAVRTHLQEYYAIITHMDQQIGRILDALEASGEMENTYIVFSADHGLAVGSHGFLGKQNMYEHSVRVPLIVAGPGIRRNHRIDTPVYIQDIHPTVLQMARVAVPDHVEFRSFLPLLRGSQDYIPYPAIYSAYTEHQRMIIQNGQKLILYPMIGVARLFDLNSDPHELYDLMVTPDADARGQAARLAAVLNEWNSKIGADQDFGEAFPELY